MRRVAWVGSSSVGLSTIRGSGRTSGSGVDGGSGDSNRKTRRPPAGALASGYLNPIPAENANAGIRLELRLHKPAAGQLAAYPIG